MKMNGKLGQNIYLFIFFERVFIIRVFEYFMTRIFNISQKEILNIFRILFFTIFFFITKCQAIRTSIYSNMYYYYYLIDYQQSFGGGLIIFFL